MKDHIKKVFKAGKAENAGWDDRQEMLSLFHQPGMEFDLKDHLLKDLYKTELKDMDSPNLKKLFNRIWCKIELKNHQAGSKTKYLYTAIGIAAALVIGLFVGIYINSLQTKPETVYYAAHSPKGSVSEVILPDGTVIFLNADSRVRYAMEGENGIREVFLTGEAWFDVAKNPDKPFVVHTSFYDVQVTGTQFNVKAYETDNEVVTTLEEGQVIIQSSEKLKLAEDIILKPGEQAVLSMSSKEFTIRNVNTKWFTSWKDNKLIFINTNLKELVVLLERRYGVEIEVLNKEILGLHFDGTIKNESIIEIMEIMKKALPISYKISGQQIEIASKK
ncbi:MAG: Fe2+-dicitrate sensor membrane [Prolixibacteraceae bacterium]|nr:MAG: Fe2+-dicitrate sensor membrane [Prolixibacteraceae bacterium]